MTPEGILRIGIVFADMVFKPATGEDINEDPGQRKEQQKTFGL
jgi:hypothetical protein